MYANPGAMRIAIGIGSFSANLRSIGNCLHMGMFTISFSIFRICAPLNPGSSSMPNGFPNRYVEMMSTYIHTSPC